jgi:spore maturation protein CgeB
MKIVYFSHALTSCWNHGNAHFQRGLLRELQSMGHSIAAYEPANSWSRQRLVIDQGNAATSDFHAVFPRLPVHTYNGPEDISSALHGAQLAIVHEWTDPAIVAAIGRHASSTPGLTLLFHDTHHRAVSDPAAMRAYDLSAYDGILAFGQSLADKYASQGWGSRAFVFHEAADTALFRPSSIPISDRRGAIWIGNWGDGERTREIETYLLRPARDAGLSLDVHGVRYPDDAKAMLQSFGARYRGWIANARVPQAFATHRLTVHVPRRFYSTALPGIPTIRVFEALACGIPLISAPWSDCEGLFRRGTDFLTAGSTEEMRRAMQAIAADDGLACQLIGHGWQRIRDHHTCQHRAQQLLSIATSLTPSLEEALV